MPYLPLSPLTGEGMDLLTDEQVQDIDQFILRYTKLQDTMGTRLFTSILNYLYEPVDKCLSNVGAGKRIAENAS
jgi:hypothetical protein